MSTATRTNGGTRGNGHASAAKPRLAIEWLSACGGCDIAILNVHEALLDVAAAFEIAYWPAAIDVKRGDLEAMPDGSIDVALCSGGIRTTEDRELAELLRAKARILVALGTCAGDGGIPGLANLSSLGSFLAASYGDDRTDGASGISPQATWQAPEAVLRLPALLPLVQTLGQVVRVDYAVPGCPPESGRIAEVLGLVVDALAGRVDLPPTGTILGAGRSTVCEECARARDVKHISRFARIQTIAGIDPEVCLLEQGLPCDGPGTRAGCGALCPAAGTPCIGCYGAPDGVVDAGARLLSAYASVVDAIEPDEIERVLDGLVDPVGQFYRFTLAGSLLGRSRWAHAEAGQAAREERAPEETAPEETAPDRVPAMAVAS